MRKLLIYLVLLLFAFQVCSSTALATNLSNAATLALMRGFSMATEWGGADENEMSYMPVDSSSNPSLEVPSHPGYKPETQRKRRRVAKSHKSQKQSRGFTTHKQENAHVLPKAAPITRTPQARPLRWHQPELQAPRLKTPEFGRGITPIGLDHWLQLRR